MSTSLAEATLEAVVRAWIHDAEVAIYSAKKHGYDFIIPAYMQQGVLRHIPKHVTLEELELEILPEIKQKLGL